MSAKLPASIGTYRIIKREELTVEQLAVLRAASREHVHARLCELVAQGRVAVSQVTRAYQPLMDEAGTDGKAQGS